MEQVTAKVIRDENGELVLVDPHAEAVFRAVSTYPTFQQQKERVRYFVQRIYERGDDLKKS